MEDCPPDPAPPGGTLTQPAPEPVKDVKEEGWWSTAHMVADLIDKSGSHANDSVYGFDIDKSVTLLSELLGWTSLAAMVVYTFLLPQK